MPNVLAPAAYTSGQWLVSARASNRPRARTAFCAASKGFGKEPQQPPASGKGRGKDKGKPKKHVSRISPDQAVERAVRIAEGGASRPVSSKEAAKGRLDYVQVKDWGSGDRRDLGSLEVDSLTTVSGDPLTSGADRPFYEQLARHLEICQAQGELDPPPGSKPLPPFEQWTFKKRHFLQYLADLLHVHYALEASILAALQPPQEGLPDEKDEESPDSVVDPALITGPYDTHVCHLLSCFTEGSGLWRSGAIARDLHEIARHSTGTLPAELEASPHADSYADDLVATASIAQQPRHGVEKQDEARLRLLAHVYSNHVAHFTTGMRIGAAATERLDLFSIGATNMYQAYPEEMGEDPLHVFTGLINAVGTELSAKEKGFVLAELPAAFYATSQLLSAVARSD